MKLWRFEERYCPKCGNGDQTTRYHGANWRCTYNVEVENSTVEGIEHLHMTCQTCSHDWVRTVKSSE